MKYVNLCVTHDSIHVKTCVHLDTLERYKQMKTVVIVMSLPVIVLLKGFSVMWLHCLM